MRREAPGRLVENLGHGVEAWCPDGEKKERMVLASGTDERRDFLEQWKYGALW